MFNEILTIKQQDLNRLDVGCECPGKEYKTKKVQMKCEILAVIYLFYTIQTFKYIYSF